MTPPPQVRLDTLPRALGDVIALYQASGDRLAVLDITTNNRLPTFAAALVSDQTERPAFAFAAAAGLDPAEAIREALSDLASSAACPGCQAPATRRFTGE